MLFLFLFFRGVHQGQEEVHQKRGGVHQEKQWKATRRLNYTRLQQVVCVDDKKNRRPLYLTFDLEPENASKKTTIYTYFSPWHKRIHSLLRAACWPGNKGLNYYVYIL
jgi:hypothetical protein